MNNKFFGLLIAAVMLSAISCSRKGEAAGPETDGGEVTVTFSVGAEDRMVSSRADISDGTKADMLVYAVYTPEYENGEITSYHLLEQYGLGVKDEESKLGDGVVAGKGQTVLYTDNLLKPEGETITLRLMRGKTYFFAFWAQNHECKAYRTTNLERVEVSYAEARNNDELRDAFCTVYMFEALPDTKVKVVLTRAMAQVNVGTAGWDYINEVGGEWGSYAYSKIELAGVYKAMNVVTNKVITGDNETVTAVYDWSRIPAYLGAKDFPEASDANYVGYLTDPANDTEFLKVKLSTYTPTEEEKGKYYDESGKYLKYLTDTPGEDTWKTPDGRYTEVFKYLSMCYVLVPSNDSVLSGNVSATTIESVKFYLAETADGTMSDGSQGEHMFTIANVPAQRNWRTNILGGTGLDNSIFDPHTVSLWVDINPGYDGDHNDNGVTSGEWPATK